MPRPASSPSCGVCARGRVRLVGFPSASPTIVPRLLADLARQHAGVSVTYLEAEPPEAVEAVRDGPRRHRADLQLPGRPRRSARTERPRAVGAGRRQRRPARRAAGRAPGGDGGRHRRLGAVGGEVDRGLPALPRASARAVRASGLRAAHRVRDRQLRRRRGTRRAGDRRRDAAAHGGGVVPAAARRRDAAAAARRGADDPRRHRARRRPRARRSARRWHAIAEVLPGHRRPAAPRN